MRGFVLQVMAFATVAACGDPGGSQNHDAPVSVPDTPPVPDAPPIPDAPGACTTVPLGAGLRPSLAHAAGHFAVAYLAVGPQLAVAQFTDAGAPAGTATAAIPMFSAQRPAIAGRGAFLVAYIDPDGNIGLSALAPGGALSAPKTIVAGFVADLLLAPSPTADEYALTYTVNDATPRFARVAADGTVLSGPVDLPTSAGERILALSHRPGAGWAVIAHRSQPAATNIYLLDEDGASANGLPEVHALAPGIPGGLVVDGTGYALTLWFNTFELKLFHLDADGIDLGVKPAMLAASAFFPGNLAAAPDGLVTAYVDQNSVAHMLHATVAGAVDDIDTLGGNVDILDFPAVAASPTGARATAWATDAPVVQLSFACP